MNWFMFLAPSRPALTPPRATERVAINNAGDSSRGEPLPVYHWLPIFAQRRHRHDERATLVQVVGMPIDDRRRESPRDDDDGVWFVAVDRFWGFDGNPVAGRNRAVANRVVIDQEVEHRADLEMMQ